MANHFTSVKIKGKPTTPRSSNMTPGEAKQVQVHIREIAAIVYRNTPDSELSNLESIEKSVRGQVLEHVSPEVAVFLSSKLLELSEARLDS